MTNDAIVTCKGIDRSIRCLEMRSVQQMMIIHVKFHRLNLRLNEAQLKLERRVFLCGSYVYCRLMEEM